MDLRTQYLGFDLPHPILASASPISADLYGIRALEDAGAAAIVLPSLFEEQFAEHHSLADRPWALPPYEFSLTPRSCLDLIARARAAVAVPVIASLNGTTRSGWVNIAREMEQAGASAIELNIFRLADDPAAISAEVEAECTGLLAAVRHRVRIPVAVKLLPYYSAFATLARRLDRAGAKGLVLFNRLYQPGIDLDSLAWSDTLTPGNAAEIRLGLHWIALLAGRLEHASLAASGGVESAEEVVKYLLAGADVVMTASALMRHGVGHLRTLKRGLQDWMARRGIESVRAIKGLLRRVEPGSEAEARARADYIQSLVSGRNTSALP